MGEKGAPVVVRSSVSVRPAWESDPSMRSPLLLIRQKDYYRYYKIQHNIYQCRVTVATIHKDDGRFIKPIKCHHLFIARVTFQVVSNAGLLLPTIHLARNTRD